MSKKSNILINQNDKKNNIQVNHSVNRTNKKQNSQKIKSKKDIIDIITQYPYILISLLCLCVYAHILSYDFVGLDDKPIIIGQDNKNYEYISNLSNIGHAFTTDAFHRDKGNFYRPMQTVSFMIDAQIGGKSTFIYHLTNLLLHILTCCFLFTLLKQINYNKFQALIGTFFFSVHPLFTHAVAWVPARNDLLITLFCIISFITFIKYNQIGKFSYLLIHIISLTLALFSKETAMAFPLVCLVYSCYVQKNKIFSKNNIQYYFIWGIVIGLWFIVRYLAIGFQWKNEEFGFIVLMKNILIVPELLTKFFLPYKIPVLPTFNIITSSIGIIIILLLSLALFFRRTNIRIAISIFGIIWFLVMILPGSLYRHTFADYFYDYLDHRAYLPMIGMIILLIELLPKTWFNIKDWRFLGLNIIIIALFAVLAYSHSTNYQNRLAFRQKAVRDDPSKAGFRLALGKAYKDEGKIDLAQKEFEEGVKQMPQEKDFYFQLGEIYFSKKDFPRTLDILRRGIAVDPSSSEAYNNLGGTYLMLGRKPEAIASWRKAIELKPDNFNVMLDLGKNYASMGNFDSAAYFANILQSKGQAEMAKNINGNILLNKGHFFYRNNDFNNAIALTIQAMEYIPNNPVVYNNLGTYYANTGNTPKAIEYWKKASSVDKNFSDNWNNLFRFHFYVLKQYKDALVYAQEYAKRGGKITKAEMEILNKYR